MFVMKHKITLFLLVSLWCDSLTGQQTPCKRDSIYSAVLREKRYLWVVLPPNYDTEPMKKFDVIYVLDGEGNTKLENVSGYMCSAHLGSNQGPKD